MSAVPVVVPSSLPSGDSATVAARWLAAVQLHRRAAGSFGKVSAAVVDTPAGGELHLTEETTFRPVGGNCPVRSALAWLAVQLDRRRDHGLTGTVHLEATDRAGKYTFARVVEVTIIQTAGGEET